MFWRLRAGEVNPKYEIRRSITLPSIALNVSFITIHWCTVTILKPVHVTLIILRIHFCCCCWLRTDWHDGWKRSWKKRTLNQASDMAKWHLIPHFCLLKGSGPGMVQPTLMLPTRKDRWLSDQQEWQEPRRLSGGGCLRRQHGRQHRSHCRGRGRLREVYWELQEVSAHRAGRCSEQRELRF